MDTLTRIKELAATQFGGTPDAIDENAPVTELGIDSLGFQSEEHTSELQSPVHLVCRLLLEKKKRFRLPVVLIQGPNAVSPSFVGTRHALLIVRHSRLPPPVRIGNPLPPLAQYLPPHRSGLA